MKVKIGEYDVECTVEEFEKLRKPAAAPPIKEVPSLVDILHSKQQQTQGMPPFIAKNSEQWEQPVNGVLTDRATASWGASRYVHPPYLPPQPNPPVPSGPGKIVRGVKSLVIGTVGRYGKQGLTRPQIQSLSGLESAQVRDGLYSAMDEDQGPPLIRQEGYLFFCTEIGESYALVSDFGKKKIVHQELYMPNGKETASK